MAGFTPVTSMIRNELPDFIGVDQLRRKNRDTEQRNALAQMAAETDQMNAQSYRAQLDAQTQARSRQASEQQAAQAREWLGNAVQTVRQNPALIPALVREGKMRGVLTGEIPDNITPEQVEEFALRYGIAPAAQPLETQRIQGGGILQRDPATGKLTQVVAPDRSTGGGAPSAPSGYRWAAGGGLAPIPGGPADPVTKGANDNRTFQRADKLRDEFNAASKELVTVGDNYAKIQEVSADNSAAGDLSLIFSYMKMLDPNSVVREQEFANAQNAAGVPDRIRAAYNKVISGERLAPAQRADFIKQAGNVYTAQNKRHEATVVKRYTAMAKRWGIDPQDVVGDLSVALPQPAAAGATTAAPAQAETTATGPNGQKLVLRDGKWVPL